MKIRIKQEGVLTKVLLDEKGVSSRLTAVSVELKVGHVPTVRLEILPDEIEIEGDFDILRKVKEEKKQENTQTGVNISMQSEQNSDFINYQMIAEQIAESVQKTLRIPFEQ